jgi:hypothetical protein
MAVAMDVSNHAPTAVSGSDFAHPTLNFSFLRLFLSLMLFCLNFALGNRGT